MAQKIYAESFGPQGRETVLPGDSDSTHLHTPLTRTEILHFSRRVGYSTKSLGLDAYAMPGLGGG